MKQLLKNMNDGKSVIADVPVPAIKPLNALVRTGASLVSVGTERMVVDFAEKSLIGKAQSRPDLVRQVIDKAKREGVLSTVEAAFGKLEQPMALGHSSAGTIVEMGEGLKGFKIGDKVACAGGGHAVHAEYGLIPQNLLVKIPERVDFESASFATLGAIALQGVRLAGVQVGEKVAVIGLGLLGLLTVQIAKAAGCDVFGVDLDAKRVELARTFGVQAGMRANAEAAGAALSNGRGFDAVLICADTKSNDPIELAGVLAREKGKVIAVGAVGLDIPRKLYYEKELDFQVSRSYGPGRYDVDYEENAVDYPYGYVRWTENRNMEAVLDLIAKGQLDVQRLITHRFDINQATEAYELISHGDPSSFLGVVITYAQNDSVPQRKIEMPAYRPLDGAIKAGLSVLGAGNYAMSTFLPAVE
ncbi:MAG TPA: zinc-binding alcohol dehydrogenase [Bellilinea sp.]|nr:zinc-binding alcohol dehydrogenase [Bellilinea sp.]